MDNMQILCTWRVWVERSVFTENKTSSHQQSVATICSQNWCADWWQDVKSSFHPPKRSWTSEGKPLFEHAPLLKSQYEPAGKSRNA